MKSLKGIYQIKEYMKRKIQIRAIGKEWMKYAMA